MTKTFVTADLHFGHRGVCRFLRDDGSPLRPWDDTDEMDAALVNNWNEVVAPEDRVYVLGDLCINRRALPTIARCVGRKVLVKGNHDIFKLKEYAEYFDDIRAYEVKPKSKIIMSHIPIHPESMKEGWLNIHGHLHYQAVRHPLYQGLPDTRYLCVSVERTNYKPVNLQEIIDERD